MTAPRELRLAGSDNTPLFVVDWPLGEVRPNRGGVMLMHGLGEHCGRYVHVARFFNECGWSVRAYDHRGHGRSGGGRGDVPDQAALLRDAKIVLDDFAKQLSAPPILLGHSMGGLFAACFAAERLSPLRGLILSSPALGVRLSGVQKILLPVLRAATPGLALPNGLPVKYLSHRQDVVQAYRDDPLVHDKITPRLLTNMLGAIDFAHSHAATLSIPTLIAVAGDDRFVDAARSHAFFARLAPSVGTMHCYQDFYHEVFNETDVQRVFGDVEDWLDRHMQ